MINNLRISLPTLLAKNKIQNICSTMYVATYVKMKCIREIIGKLIAEVGKGGLGALENILLVTPLILLENVGNI